MKRSLVIIGVLMTLVTVACETTSPPPRHVLTGPTQPVAPSVDPITIAAAGDIACQSPPGNDLTRCQYRATSDLLLDREIDAVLVLGDSQYLGGQYENYLRYFDPTWGRVFRKIYPVIGNEDFADSPTSATGYYRYFGDRWRGPDGLGYYSFNLPKGCTPKDPLCWHVIALNSELCLLAGGCGPPSGDDQAAGERMYSWLIDDLDEHPQSEYPCTIAMFHRPLFDDAGVATAIRPLWNLLYGAEVDVVLNGHDHHYERWRQMTPAGRPDPGRGIREFVVGTGGKNHGRISTLSPNVERAQDDAFGVLEMQLFPGTYRWRWVSAPGQPTSFRDASAHPALCV
jgi:hypothetical protein